MIKSVATFFFINKQINKNAFIQSTLALEIKVANYLHYSRNNCVFETGYVKTFKLGEFFFFCLRSVGCLEQIVLAFSMNE